jgi:hypothetical protein
MTDEEIKAGVARAFADVPRPERFTPREHCEECAEHDETLRRFDPDTIGLEQLGNPGWDPMCYVSPEAFRYYFPALVRLALDSGGGPHSYLSSFLFHVLHDGENNLGFRHFTRPQREATLAVLRHLRTNRSGEIEAWALQGELDDAVALWTGLAAEEQG